MRIIRRKKRKRCLIKKIISCILIPIAGTTIVHNHENYDLSEHVQQKEHQIENHDDHYHYSKDEQCNLTNHDNHQYNQGHLSKNKQVHH